MDLLSVCQLDSMIKPDHWIRTWADQGGIAPFDPAHINAASIDVCLADHWITADGRSIHAPSFRLAQHEVVLASTLEYITMPRHVAGDLKLKSTLGRLWLNHSLSGWLDPGFEGNITLELQYLGPGSFVLDAGRRVAQVIFMSMSEPPSIAYGESGSGSHYQKQTGTTPSFQDVRTGRCLCPCRHVTACALCDRNQHAYV